MQQMRLTATARCVLSHVVRQKPILKTLPLPLLLAAHGPGREGREGGEGGQGGRAGGYKVYGSPCHCQCYTAQHNTQHTTHTHTDTPRGPLAGPRNSHSTPTGYSHWPLPPDHTAHVYSTAYRTAQQHNSTTAQHRTAPHRTAHSTAHSRGTYQP